MVGEEAAFEELFYQYYPLLCVNARRILVDEDQAKEIVQDVFVRFYEHRERLLPIDSLKAYLFKAVQNACLNQLKQQRIYRNHHQQLQNILPHADEIEPVLLLELEEKIWQAVQHLPDQCRRIFLMNRFDNKKNKDIAQELGLSIRTVETQISKALKILRETLSDYLPVLLLLTPANFF